MYTADAQTILETETVQITTKFATEALQLTTILLKIHCTDHTHYTIGILANETNCLPEFHMIHDISRNNKDAMALFNAIADGYVTPCTLGDVLEDMIGIH